MDKRTTLVGHLMMIKIHIVGLMKKILKRLLRKYVQYSVHRLL